jgi:hypothetical protein
VAVFDYGPHQPPVGAEEMPRDYQFFAPTALDRCMAIS